MERMKLNEPGSHMLTRFVDLCGKIPPCVPRYCKSLLLSAYYIYYKWPTFYALDLVISKGASTYRIWMQRY